MRSTDGPRAMGDRGEDARLTPVTNYRSLSRSDYKTSKRPKMSSPSSEAELNCIQKSEMGSSSKSSAVPLKIRFRKTISQSLPQWPCASVLESCEPHFAAFAGTRACRTHHTTGEAFPQVDPPSSGLLLKPRAGVGHQANRRFAPSVFVLSSKRRQRRNWIIARWTPRRRRSALAIDPCCPI